MSLHNLQNELCTFAGVLIRVMLRLGLGLCQICKLHMHDLEIAQHILQIAQIDKLHATRSQPMGLRL